ncbi:MAG: dienelactone hydrolase family protein [Candidatus Thorarchaeota archaeon]|nr:dienelactone hydrolase family protein [Candidatus Thorarchaeota archaeon]
MESTRFEFEVEELTLVGILKKPDINSNTAVILLHPHPLYGGDMNNHVVREMESLFLNLGYTTLRFDFRGTQSHPKAFSGISGATKDVDEAAIALEDRGISINGVIGYSFGGSTTLRFASKKSLNFIITLSASYTLLCENEYHSNELSSIKCPVLMFHGISDDMVPFMDMNSISQLLTCPVKLVGLDQENHFYQQSLDLVKDEIRTFINSM